MATQKKTQISKIENVLLNHKASPGVAITAIARMTRVPRTAISKCVYDLRERYTITSNYHNVNGKKTLFYRLTK